MSTKAPSGQTVLVTGGAGFIGSHLVEALQPGNKVRILDNFLVGERDRIPPEVELYEGDVRDTDLLREAMAGVDIVYHEAAFVNVDRSVEQPTESHSINVSGTLAVLEQARDTLARVIIASSGAIYGHPDELPVRENSHKKPLSPYGLDKLAIDHYNRLYHDLYDLETVTLRYFNVYGPRTKGGPYAGVIETFTRQALAGDPITVHGDGTQTRDFVSVRDIVQANLSAATTDAVGEAFNIGTGSQTSIRELAELIVDLIDTDSEITHVNPRPGDVQRSQADISSGRSKLGYEPSVSLEDGLAEFVDWYEANVMPA